MESLFLLVILQARASPDGVQRAAYADSELNEVEVALCIGGDSNSHVRAFEVEKIGEEP